MYLNYSLYSDLVCETIGVHLEIMCITALRLHHKHSFRMHKQRIEGLNESQETFVFILGKVFVYIQGMAHLQNFLAICFPKKHSDLQLCCKCSIEKHLIKCS